MRVALVIALALAAGCKEPRHAKPQARDAAVARADARPSVTIATCITADDCALSTHASDHDCCGDLCGHMTAHRKDGLDKMLADLDGLCSRKDYECKHADCARIELDQLPGCSAGACVVVNVPRATPCTTDADCVLTTAARGECCGPKCGVPLVDAVHADDAAALDAWRSANCDLDACPTAKCEKPDFRTEARCTKGTCVAERIPLTEPR